MQRTFRVREPLNLSVDRRAGYAEDDGSMDSSITLMSVTIALQSVHTHQVPTQRTGGHSAARCETDRSRQRDHRGSGIHFQPDDHRAATRTGAAGPYPNPAQAGERADDGPGGARGQRLTVRDAAPHGRNSASACFLLPMP